MLAVDGVLGVLGVKLRREVLVLTGLSGLATLLCCMGSSGRKLSKKEEVAVAATGCGGDAVVVRSMRGAVGVGPAVRTLAATAAWC